MNYSVACATTNKNKRTDLNAVNFHHISARYDYVGHVPAQVQGVGRRVLDLDLHGTHHLDAEQLTKINGYIFTRILQQIYTFSNKVKQASG